MLLESVSPNASESPASDKIPVSLAHLPTGARLLVRSRVDWRFASVSKRIGDRIVLTVCSPSGRTYRLRRDTSELVLMDGTIPVLITDNEDSWRSNFTTYDPRW